MSFIKLGKNYFEYSTLELHPDVFYVSSSEGISGQQFVEHFRTNRIKDFFDGPSRVPDPNLGLTIPFSDGKDLFSVPEKILVNANSNIIEGLDPDNPTFLQDVNNSPVSLIYRKGALIKRTEPGKTAFFDIEQSKKNTIRKNLSTFYKSKYPDLGWHYSNYHTLNFFKANNLPNDSCLMYPNYDQKYTPSGPFSICFNINPRYDNETTDLEYDAGTIFHLSSSIAISIVSGSQTDKKGLVSSYKILLQLSQSADIAPSSINLSNIPGGYPNDLIYLSKTEMFKNTWNHVTIRWDPEIKNSSGSIVINRKQTYFPISSASLSTNNHSLIVGNYYNGNSVNLLKYFNTSKQETEGITAIDSSVANEPVLQTANLNHCLQAEMHNLMLFNKYITDKELLFLDTFGINNKKLRDSSSQSLYSHLLFYLPPYFVPESPLRNNVIINPYNSIVGQPETPFSVPLSFSLGAKIINLENFSADFANPENLSFPRLQSLTASIINRVENPKIKNDDFIFNSSVSPQIIKRNLTILPNDNGLFSPDYYPILASNHATSPFYRHSVKSFVSKSFGTMHNYTITDKVYDYSKISLENLTIFHPLYNRTLWNYNEDNIADVDPDDLAGQQIFVNLFGPYNDNSNVGIHSLYAMLNRYSIPAITKDVSSNEVVIFDASQLFYGNSIQKETFSIIDSGLSGSSGKIKISLRDNGAGSLYRSDALTRKAKWNNVGDIIYEEGIATILSPHLIKFCKDKTNIRFKGSQTLHTMITNVPVLKEYFNSSSNITYVGNPPNTGTNEEHLSSHYITAVNIHDNNFNIIMKAHFSQPIVKTEEDEFVIRLKQDF